MYEGLVDVIIWRSLYESHCYGGLYMLVLALYRGPCMEVNL